MNTSPRQFEGDRRQSLARAEGGHALVTLGNGAHMISLRLQIRIGDSTRIGHGKIRLLEEIEKTGSISAAARAVGMNYRRGWELIDQMNRAFGKPLVTGTTGGLGGAEVTSLGRDIMAHYRSIEEKVSHIATSDLRAIEDLVQTGQESPL